MGHNLIKKKQNNGIIKYIVYNEKYFINHICKCTCIVGYNFKMNFLLYVMVQKLDHVLLESKAIYSWAFLK